MKKINKFMLFSILVICLLCMFGCKKNNGSSEKRFGKFSYNGYYLVDRAASDITYNEAKSIVSKNRDSLRLSASNFSNSNGNDRLSVSTFDIDSTTPKQLVDDIMTKYAKCTITTNYSETGKEELQQKVDLLQGTDFKNMIETNLFAGYSQLLAKNIVIFSDLIDEMEQANEKFKQSETSKIAPFKNIFTYHKDSAGNLVIQIHDFAEIPSSVGGGIGCSYLQDTEIVYDSEGKVNKWMTSLGVYSATPTGTIQQGYILFVDFAWTIKE